MKALFILLAFPVISLAQPLLLTGEIGSARQQIVSAPRTTSWNISVQWMAEEGSIVEPGDPVVIFDGASTLSQLQQNQDRLIALRQDYDRLQIEHQQTVADAEAAFSIANLEVEKARIEAGIPAGKVSDYDKGQFELALERALLEKIKAEQQLALKKQERTAELSKQRIEITKIEEQIDYQQQLLQQLKVQAQLRGPITHANHPWNREKITAGSNVQPSWRVLEIQAMADFEVHAWAHEIDAARLSVGQTASISLDAFAGQRFAGQIEQVSSQAESKAEWGDSSYYPVVISFVERPTQTLQPGMSVRIQVAEQ